jgi:hypothetical protein
LDFIFLENKNRYNTRVLKSGPFIDGYEFIDNEKKKKYKISNGIPFPYVIYGNFLYRPLEFNVLFKDKIRNEMFIKYALE